MEGLGRVFDVNALADDVYVPMKNCGAVSFICYLAAGDTYTLTEATDASGTGAQVLTTITRFHKQATPGAAWAEVTQAAASTMVVSSAFDVCVLTISGAELSDGYKFLKLASTSTGTVTAVLHDLAVQRKPGNLAALV
jgi:hypothetical protein